MEMIAQYGSLGLFVFLLTLTLCCVFLGPEAR
jgi:hypothetical protein